MEVLNFRDIVVKLKWLILVSLYMRDIIFNK